ncbi:MAG: hypothetical protein FJY85_12435 [Deltaproteobacteria bacterium]|nr:hypothetical protein [Deltaproteobacteria bacterium]
MKRQAPRRVATKEDVTKRQPQHRRIRMEYYRWEEKLHLLAQFIPIDWERVDKIKLWKKGLTPDEALDVIEDDQGLPRSR